jgi:predicted metal-dependent phosphoesterase TrpH
MNLHFGPVEDQGAAKDMALIDMHLHTKYSMDCATKINTIYKMAKRRHIGLAVTDHNEIKGVKALAAFRDLNLIPGIEVTSAEFRDVLLYFDTLRDLESFYARHVQEHVLKLRRIRLNRTDLTIHEIIEAGAQSNATIVLPHPFAVKNTYEHFRRNGHAASLKGVHAIEAANGTMTRKENMAAYGWAQMLHKPITGGSDSHIYWSVGCIVTAADEHTPSSFLAQVRAGNTQVFGTEQRKHIKLATNMAMIKYKLLKNKKIPSPKARIET